MGHPPILVRRLWVAHREQAAAALASALAEDPWMRWALEPDRFEAGVRELTAGDVDDGLRDGELWAAGEVEAVAVWAPPQGAGDRLRAIAESFDPAEERLYGPRLGAVEELELQTAQSFPERTYWYLELLGTVPEARGRGLGSAVLGPALKRCDRDGIAAALDTPNRDALGFYERLGFVALPSVRVADSPEIWPLVREPSGG